LYLVLWVSVLGVMPRTQKQKTFPTRSKIKLGFEGFNFRLRLEALSKFIYCLKWHDLERRI
jgi:hypothetical protein